MSKSGAEVINRYKSNIAKTWIRQESFGNKGKTLTPSYQEELEPDGRRRGRAITELCANGYLNIVDSKVQVTIKAFNEVKGSKPDFAKMFENQPRAVPSGFRFEELHIEEQKYIFDNKGDYQFFYESIYSDRTQVPTELGIVPNFEKIRSSNLMVKDAAFDAARQKYVDEVEFAQARKSNLTWGLMTLGLLSEDDADFIKVKDSPLSSGLFKADPANWGTDLDTELEKVQKRVQELTQRQTVLASLKSKVGEYGGWDKFLNEYDYVLLTELKKEKRQPVAS